MAWHDKDKAGKWLVTHQAGALLRLAGVQGVRSWRALQPEAVQPSQLPDGLLEVELAGRSEPVLVLLELATKPERRLERQLVRAMQMVYLERHVLPEVVAVILQPRGRYCLPPVVEMRSPLGLSHWRGGWHVVELWTLRAEDLLATEDVGVVPWVPLAAFAGQPEALLRECRDRIEREAAPVDKEPLLAATRIMARLRYNDRGLLDLLFRRTSMIKWTDFPDIREAMDEVRAVERLVSLREAVRLLLQARFHKVPKVVVREVERIKDDARLKELIALAAKCSDLDSFRASLAR
jgi:hypothetical protein